MAKIFNDPDGILMLYSSCSRYCLLVVFRIVDCFGGEPDHSGSEVLDDLLQRLVLASFDGVLFHDRSRLCIAVIAEHLSAFLDFFSKTKIPNHICRVCRTCSPFADASFRVLVVSWG
jgi:hypothetical protein